MCFSYGGIYEKGSKEYTLDDFHSLALDKMDRYTCLKKSEIVIMDEEESSSDDDEDGDDEDGDDEYEDEDYGDEEADEETHTFRNEDEDLEVDEPEAALASNKVWILSNITLTSRHAYHEPGIGKSIFATGHYC
jgi:hypothetical protein